ncbi:MAG: UDP-glucose 4-epimerase GalE [Ignavibacteria bacterium]|jgi:UDP-glucose 4-epimerase|nr:UDP-glucose 4-epimerase GalE [Ignavibacteria bacterium]
MSSIIITGGLGYIGSHTAVELLNCGYNVIIVDNLSNSVPKTLDRIKKITGKEPIFFEIDVCDKNALTDVFKQHSGISAVIHFAAYKAVAESVAKPLEYYKNNVMGLINLLECMNEANCQNLVFSSSCTVYGEPDLLPVTEKTPLKPAASPYGNTKKISEDVIFDTIQSGAKIKAISLRYFNPVGAHPSALLGELPQGTPNNLMPLVTQAALGKREKLFVYGSDYNTKDGTAIRDYIHVSDLAVAHIKALDWLFKQESCFYDIFNIGTGTGNSVLEVIESMNKNLEKPLPYEIVARRPGDVEKIYANSEKANKVLDWQAKYTLDDMTKTSLDWEKNL